MPDTRESRFLLVGALSRSLVLFRGPLLESLVASGWDVHTAANALDEDPETLAGLAALKVTPHTLPIQRTGLNVAADLMTLRAMVQLFRRIRPQAILAYTIKPVVWGMIAGWIAGVPRRYALITGLGYAFAGEAKGKRGIIRAIAQNLYRVALSRSHGIFFQNPDDAALFAELDMLPLGVPVMIVNGSGVDLRHYKPQLLPPQPLRFLLIARLLGDKGIREYATAAAIIRSQHPDVEFHLVGGTDSNPNAISLDELSDWQNDGNIIYHGEQADVRPHIANCHVYVLPSYREGTPRTVLEAMAMGRPIVTTDAPGCRETVVHGKNGFLVPVRAPDALAAAMKNFIESPDLIQTMGSNALEIARLKYDVNRVNASMLASMDFLNDIPADAGRVKRGG